MSNKRVRPLVVLFAVSLFGCAEGSSVAPLEIEKSGVDLGSVQGVARATTMRDRFLRVSNRLVGFAGAHLEKDGSFVVSVSQETTAEEARTALLSEMPELQQVMGSSVQIRKVTHSYKLLADWYPLVQGAALSVAGGQLSTRIDPVLNRIVVGTEDRSHSLAVLARLRVSPVPVDAYEVMVEGKSVPLADLNQRIRPVVGGLLVTRPLSPYTHVNCTMGPTAVRNGVLGFIVNSHCTPSTGVDGTIWYQYRPGNSSDRLGVEAFEGGLTNCTQQYASLPGVPTGATFGCRLADAAWIQFDAGVVSSNSVKKGHVARTTSGTTLHGSTWRVVGAMLTVVGSTIQKTGRVTGTTSGTITEQCVDEFLPIPGGVDFIVEQCQTRASVVAHQGDSGSPIYFPFLTIAQDAIALEGIVASGRNCNTGGQCLTISYPPVANIVADLGLGSWSAFLP